jgi:hypothetical protein
LLSVEEVRVLRVLEMHCCHSGMDRSRRHPLLELLREVEEGSIVLALEELTKVEVAEVQVG